ncbi:PAB-dependent poly(A)-specific ribonuclease subunit pan3 [Neolecta irregularis DAH-3]|uniref:PAN2-PAN3 deadenylation complex subunit PAN3 n=1 Tax=Neolecta irregularis (strain DAH-3) TaxID=1198029 RepID=A0A1U7LNQ1_NEOID|nr:PAB-dependent poly(A)-specific ribonuclease subunit pan3 [Neolecta irregularis DAH-3]|eukprot:OLL24258.1 PAB-dependent poly(A)-specific ribonuclease subunit pan3 [Neolecta irregularis DAH-3]
MHLKHFAGCMFKHERDPPPQPKLERSSTKLKADSPHFKPVTMSSKPIAADMIKAAPFVPKTATEAKKASSVDDTRLQTPTDMMYGTGYTPSVTNTPYNETNYTDYGFQGNQMTSDFASMTFSPSANERHTASTTTTEQTNQYDYVAPTMDMYYSQPTVMPPQYHLYASLPPHSIKLASNQTFSNGFFLPDEFRVELQRKCEATLQTFADTSLPESVGTYHSLVPLDYQRSKSRGPLGATMLYKAMSRSDGKAYALRTFDAQFLKNDQGLKVIDSWRRVDSSSLISVYEAFTTKAFGNNAVVVVYDYHPLLQTLLESRTGRVARLDSTAQEQQLWSFMCQIALLLTKAHAAGLAVRAWDPSKVLVTSKSRIRFSGCGLLDIMEPSQTPIDELQRDDLVQMGRLIVHLATNSFSLADFSNVDAVLSGFSLEFRSILRQLLGQITGIDTVSHLITALAPHLADSLDASFYSTDYITTLMTRELENGRLVRLLCKLGFINERGEFELDKQWSEGGDRYVIKLFRDYVFHQVDEKGAPVVDLAHVLTCLNKLDAGVDEKIALVTRDENNIIVISYKELKSAIDTAFSMLTYSRPQ